MGNGPGFQSGAFRGAGFRKLNAKLLFVSCAKSCWMTCTVSCVETCDTIGATNTSTRVFVGCVNLPVELMKMAFPALSSTTNCDPNVKGIALGNAENVFSRVVSKTKKTLLVPLATYRVVLILNLVAIDVGNNGPRNLCQGFPFTILSSLPYFVRSVMVLLSSGRWMVNGLEVGDDSSQTIAPTIKRRMRMHAHTFHQRATSGRGPDLGSGCARLDATISSVFAVQVSYTMW